MTDTTIEPAPAPARAGTLLLRGVVGSTAYGLAHAGSDHDHLGVYVAPTEAVLGLTGHAAVTASQVTEDPDQQLHEVGKFASLAIKTNPTITELLWLDTYETSTPHGQLLIDIRTAFLSRPCVLGAYGGYAHQQARKLVARAGEGKTGFSSNTGGRTAKHGRHCLRLLRQAKHLLETGHLLVNVAHLRDELFAAGELATTDPDAFFTLFTAEMAALDQVDSVLPEQADHATVNDALVTIRRAHLS